MAYTINLTDGAIFATVADGTINTSSSMVLVGKNYAGYGEFLDENFIHLLENGANTTAPGAPLTGQLWWDKSTNTMKVYTGTVFKTISAATAASSAPGNNVTGDLWFNTSTDQLNVWNGSSFILVGPASTSTQGTSGAIVETIIDNASASHTVVFLYAGGTRVASISKDATFTPQVPIAGFPTIGPGQQLSDTPGLNALFRGTATDSNLLGGVASSGFVRNSGNNQSMSVALSILNDSGLSVGADADARIIITGSDVFLRNQTQDGNLTLQVNDGGVNTTAININGQTGVPGVTGLTNLNANGVGNLGSSSGYFNTVFATATTALYADVAERFAADTVYEPGTVVELGGTAEITRSVEELSDNVFGVISTRAAFTMNHGAGSDATHPPVAMTGRVPVQVVGSVRKGDRLVSAGNGLARAAAKGEATAFNVIGRALEDRLDTAQGMVEAIVTIK